MFNNFCYNFEALQWSASGDRFPDLSGERKVRTPKGSEPVNDRACCENGTTTSATEKRPALKKAMGETVR